MILVAGLTPAWQQIAVLDRLRVGEVNRAREVHWCASGKVLNVGLALTQLGANVRTLSLIGSGAAGEAMQTEMALMGVDLHWIESSSPQRVCTTLLDRATCETTEIVENSPTVMDAELQAFSEGFAKRADVAWCDMVVLTGSLPRGTQTDFLATLLRAAPRRAVLDIRGPELLAALPLQPMLVKPNREELAQTVGRLLPTEADVWDAMSEIHDQGAKWVVTTDGPREVLVSHEDRQEFGRWRLIPPKVELVNPIGCGDCLAAGLAYSLQHRDGGMLDAIRFGIAAAAFNATQLFPARLELQQVTSLAGQVVTESIA